MTVSYSEATYLRFHYIRYEAPCQESCYTFLKISRTQLDTVLVSSGLYNIRSNTLLWENRKVSSLLATRALGYTAAPNATTHMVNIAYYIDDVNAIIPRFLQYDTPIAFAMLSMVPFV